MSVASSAGWPTVIASSRRRGRRDGSRVSGTITLRMAVYFDRLGDHFADDGVVERWNSPPSGRRCEDGSVE